MDKETAKEKVAKLMAMATDGRGNAFEAEAAMRQAQKLMQKFGIDAAELYARTGEKPVYKWDVGFVVPSKRGPVKTLPLWFQLLATGVGIFTDCRVVGARETNLGVGIRFEGDETDVAYAMWLCEHLRDDCQYQSTLGFSGEPDEQKSFRKAYAIRVQMRMKAMVAERRQAFEAHKTSTGTALVVVDQKLVERDLVFGEQKFKQSRGIRLRQDGASAGDEAGRRANFSRPVEHQQRPKLR
jgi:hypothetical protein